MLVLIKICPKMGKMERPNFKMQTSVLQTASYYSTFLIDVIVCLNSACSDSSVTSADYFASLHYNL